MLRAVPRLLTGRQTLRALDEAGVDVGLVAGRDEHHLGVGDLDDVAAAEDGVGAALQHHVVQADAIAAVDADVPGGRLLAVVEDLRVQPGHELAGAQVDVDLGQRAGRDGDGARLLVQLLLAVRGTPDVDVERLDVVGPVPSRDLGVRADAPVLRLRVGVLARHVDLLAGDVQAGDDRVDEVLVGLQLVIGRRVVRLVRGGGLGRLDLTGRRGRTTMLDLGIPRASAKRIIRSTTRKDHTDLALLGRGPAGRRVRRLRVGRLLQLAVLAARATSARRRHVVFDVEVGGGGGGFVIPLSR